MEPKPKHLGPLYGSQFQDPSVVEAYEHRPPLPAQTTERLLALLPAASRTVLDAGCGPGEIARALAPHVDRVDAIDASRGMIDRGRSLPGADDPSLRWICAPMESAPLDPPYGLIVASQSLHWMDWETTLPRLDASLAADGQMVLVDVLVEDLPWSEPLSDLIARYSTNRDYAPYDIVDELEQRGLFRQTGEAHTAVSRFDCTVDDYVESFHSANGFSRDRMSAEAASDFDRRLTNLVRRHCPHDVVRRDVRAWLRWGRPARTNAPAQKSTKR